MLLCLQCLQCLSPARGSVRWHFSDRHGSNTQTGITWGDGRREANTRHKSKFWRGGGQQNRCSRTRKRPGCEWKQQTHHRGHSSRTRSKARKKRNQPTNKHRVQVLIVHSVQAQKGQVPVIWGKLGDQLQGTDIVPWNSSSSTSDTSAWSLSGSRSFGGDRWEVHLRKQTWPRKTWPSRELFMRRSSPHFLVRNLNLGKGPAARMSKSWRRWRDGDRQRETSITPCFIHPVAAIDLFPRGSVSRPAGWTAPRATGWIWNLDGDSWKMGVYFQRCLSQSEGLVSS